MSCSWDETTPGTRPCSLTKHTHLLKGSNPFHSEFLERNMCEWKVPLEKCDLESGGDGAAAGVWRGVRGGVLEKPGVESPLERSLLQTCTPGFGNGGEGVRDPRHSSDWPGGHRPRGEGEQGVCCLGPG